MFFVAKLTRGLFAPPPGSPSAREKHNGKISASWRGVHDAQRGRIAARSMGTMRVTQRRVPVKRGDPDMTCDVFSSSRTTYNFSLNRDAKIAAVHGGAGREDVRRTYTRVRHRSAYLAKTRTAPGTYMLHVLYDHNR